ncbi:MAG: nodulation protein NfeD [Bacteroidota bacterium]|nr:nodulation protein NfeD [Bacteroidota bacterium]
MKRIVLCLLLFPGLPVLAQTVVTIRVDGMIGPVTAGFIHRSIQKAGQEKAQCLIIRLNTPGGLLESTRRIVSDLLESPMPVIVYVSPAGAHAGSAGVFITMAAAIGAMAPGTNLGAAHPVDLQGQQDTVMNAKVMNDAAAFIRTIAVRRHRNVQWAELAVRKSVSLTENEALAQHVIDLLANNTADLLAQLDGRTIEGYPTLHTRSAPIITLEMGFTEKTLDLISNPNITYILLLLGMFGILLELLNPGAILPGIVGVISLILAFYSMQSLPVNYAGVALIVFAVILFLIDIKIASHGLVAIGGIVSFLLGSMMLIRPDNGFDVAGISMTVILAATTVTALFFLTVIVLGLRAQRAKPSTGPAALIGTTGIVTDVLAPTGRILVQGEYWNAESATGSIAAGEKVRIIGVQSLKLMVEKQ